MVSTEEEKILEKAPDESVSIIIGIRNRYDHRILNALKSIRTQTHDARLIEILLVDYGSDPTFHPLFNALCERFQARGIWTGIEAVWSRGHCLNIGLKQARSKYVLFSDVDIVFEKKYIFECLQQMKQNASQAIYCRALDCPRRAVLGEMNLPEAYEVLKNEATLRTSRYLFPHGIGILFAEKQAVKKIRGYDEVFRLWGKEDSDLVKRLKRSGIAIQKLRGKSSHLHQWHEKHEGVNNPRFKETIRFCDAYSKGFFSVQKNSNGWGEASGREDPIIPENPALLPGSFWGITCFYNPARYKNKIKNYRIFRAGTKHQKLQLLAVELAFEGQPFELGREDAEILIQLRTSSKNVLWQKEALLNVGLARLPKECDKVAWLDSDVLFTNQDWVKETSRLLEKHAVVQPYEFAVRLLPWQKGTPNPEHAAVGLKTGQKWYGIAYGAHFGGRDVLSKYMSHGVVGYAWAARRELLKACGFYDPLIFGSADLITAYAFLNNDNPHAQSVLLSEAVRKSRDDWARRVYAGTRGSVSYCPGYLLHLWHGAYKDRLYATRDRLFEKYKFSFGEDVKKNPDGVWEWASDRFRLQEAIKNYFFRRREDSVFSGFAEWVTYYRRLFNHRKNKIFKEAYQQITGKYWL